MPKDREKYRYIDVGLERGSWTLAMFGPTASKISSGIGMAYLSDFVCRLIGR